MSEAIVVALITAGLPTCVTVLATALQNRRSRRDVARQSIESKIMWDEFGWEIFGRYPTNYGEIQDLYAIYHRNGGDGDVTRQVTEYGEWFEMVDAAVRKDRKNNKATLNK